MPQPSDDILAQYNALLAGNGFADLSGRTQIEFTGADRASFLHNLCTNEVKKLPIGGGCETFITNVQGRTIGHGYIFCLADSLVFDSVPGQGEFLCKHFEKYHIREKVEIIDRSTEWGEVLLESRLQPAESGLFNTALSNLSGNSIAIRRVAFLGSGSHFLSAPAAEIPHIIEKLRAAGAVSCSLEALEMARVEAGVPYFGRDITDQNLPQEVARDNRAISFTKGCYLGQETVARIDALGHVNQMLVGERFDAETVPTDGTLLLAGDKPVGHVTSTAWSPRLAAFLALAYVRREHAAAGTALDSSCGSATVVSLPIL